MARLLVGLGSWNMRDDAVGLRLVEHFAQAGCPGGFEPLLIHQDAMQLLFYFEPETEEILLVDAVRMGLAPGEWLLFSPEEVASRKDLAEISSHESDLLRIIGLARELGLVLPRIRILGVEPAAMEWGQELSDSVSERFKDYVRELSNAMLG